MKHDREMNGPVFLVRLLPFLLLAGCATNHALELGIGDLKPNGKVNLSVCLMAADRKAADDADAEGGRPMEGCSLSVVLSAEGDQEAQAPLDTDERGQVTVDIVPFALTWLGADVVLTAALEGSGGAGCRVSRRFDALTLLHTVQQNLARLDPDVFEARVGARRQDVLALAVHELSSVQLPARRIQRLLLFRNLAGMDLQPDLSRIALKDADGDLRAIAAQDLQAFNWDRVGPIRNSLAGETVGNLGAIVEAAQDDYYWIRLLAMEATTRLHDHEAMSLLIRALSDPHPYVRSMAARMLSNHKDKRAVEALERASREDPYIGVRLAAKAALKKADE